MDDSGYIKLHRSILKWEWYDDIPTRTVFIHCLLKANYRDNNWHGIEIKRGQFLSSLSKIAKETGLSIQQVRTAIANIRSTQEVTQVPSRYYTILAINNYDTYQDNQHELQQRINTPSTHTKKEKKEKKDTENKSLYGASTVEKVIKTFTERIQTIPVDKNTRRVAWNITQLITTYLKRTSAMYVEVGITPSFEYVLGRAWDWYMTKDWSANTTTLDTFKRYLKAYLHDTEVLLVQKTHHEK